MLEEFLIESCHIVACRAVNKHTVEYVHADYFLAQVIDVAGSRLCQFLAIVAEVDTVAVEYRVVTARNAHNIQFETACLLEFLILRVNLRDKISAHSSHSAYKEVEHVVFAQEERVVEHVERLTQIL